MSRLSSSIFRAVAQVRSLMWLSLAATLALGATAEAAVGQLAGLGDRAWLLPVSIDCYVVSAFATGGRDVRWALGVLAATIGGGHAYLAWHETAGDGRGERAILGLVVGLVVVLILWRVERAAVADAARRRAAVEAERQRAEAAAAAQLAAEAEARRKAEAAARRGRGRTRASGSGEAPDLQPGDHDHLANAKAAAARLADREERVSRDALVREMRAAGQGVGPERAGRLLAAVRAS